MSAHFECPAGHDHALTHTCYKLHRCRCIGCRSMHARYTERRTKAILYGRWDQGLVPIGPVIDHLHFLSEFGIGYKRVAEIAGVSRTVLAQTLRGVHNGRPKTRIASRTANAVLAVKPNIDLVADGARIPARGAHRRVQALVALGWSVTRIANELDWSSPANFHGMLHSSHVLASTHRQIAAVYDRLSVRRPQAGTRFEQAGVTRALRTASRNGWVPPAAWDDIDTDPAPAVVDDVDVIDDRAIELVAAGETVTLTSAEQIELVRRLTEQGRSAADIADVLGVASRTVTRIRARMNEKEGAA